MNNMEMVLVPAGCFMMGSVDNNADADENPIHEQCVEEPFWIGRYEVTNRQYGSAGAYSGDAFPRDNVRWENAYVFCSRLGGRLPTEVEWEYAARGPDNLLYPWGNDFVPDNVAYYLEADGETQRTLPSTVGSYPTGSSWVGAMDMSGNLWEWTNSIYFPYPYDPQRAENPNDTNSNHTLRGGDWHGTRRHVRGANRFGEGIPITGSDGVGFRCVRDYEDGD